MYMRVVLAVFVGSLYQMVGSTLASGIERPPLATRVQRIGKIEIPWFNNGRIGWTTRFLGREPCNSGEIFSGIEFPRASHMRWGGASIWIGGIKDGDTLVSTTGDAYGSR